jgi:hypothetical protein
MYFLLWKLRKREREGRERGKEGREKRERETRRCYNELSYIWKFMVAKWMDMLYFEVCTGGIKWFIIAKYKYYEIYKRSDGDALKELNGKSNP